MDNVTEIHMEKCRLCQENTGSHPLEDNLVLQERIFRFLNVKIEHIEFNKHLPSSICNLCYAKLDDIYKFISTIQKINNILIKHATNCQKIKSPIDTLQDGTGNISAIQSEQITPYDCQQCQKQFPDHESRDIHEKDEHLTVFICSCCGLKFVGKSKKRYYRYHLRKNHGMYCEKCNVLFEDVELMWNHKCKENSTKNDEILKKSKLETIKIEFDATNTESNHLELRKTVSKQWKCSKADCNKTYATRYLLNLHLMCHDGKKSHLCVVCGKSFMTKGILSSHEKTHLEVKTFKCEPCNLGFSARSGFRTHCKRYHEGHRFYCSKCTKAFLDKSSLDRHEKTHLGVKDFKCELCTEAFYTKKELTRHGKYHGGVKQYKCQECYKTFFEKYHLVIHTRSHTGVRPYKCDLPGCTKSFVDSFKLKRHQNTRHNP